MFTQLHTNWVYPPTDCLAPGRNARCIDQRTCLLSPLPRSSLAPPALPLLCCPSPMAARYAKAAYAIPWNTWSWEEWARELSAARRRSITVWSVGRCLAPLFRLGTYLIICLQREWALAKSWRPMAGSTRWFILQPLFLWLAMPFGLGFPSHIISAWWDGCPVWTLPTRAWPLQRGSTPLLPSLVLVYASCPGTRYGVVHCLYSVALLT